VVFEIKKECPYTKAIKIEVQGVHNEYKKIRADLATGASWSLEQVLKVTD
jgi:hypothetical protein